MSYKYEKKKEFQSVKSEKWNGDYVDIRKADAGNDR